MNMKALSLWLALSAFFVVPDQSVSAVISVDLLTVGDGLLTRDLDNGLDWLDLPLTMSGGFNRTFADISGKFGPGAEFDGFRYATLAELTAFWTSAGIPEIDAGGTAANFTPVSNLIQLLGSTSPNPSLNEFSQGILGVSNSPGTHQSAAIELIASLGRAQTFAFDVGDSEATLTGGSFLVRSSASAVPEPSVVALLTTLVLMGFAGWGAASRWRRAAGENGTPRSA